MMISCFRIIARTTEGTYINFRHQYGGCFTWHIGKQDHTGPQLINLGKGKNYNCARNAVVPMHEIMHTLGCNSFWLKL